MGITAAQLLAKTGVDPKRIADADCLISLEQYQMIIGNMIKLSGNPCLGPLLADIVKPRDLGIVGYALMSSSSLRQSLRVWTEYSNSLVGSLIRQELIDDTPPGYTYAYKPLSNIESICRFGIEEELFAGMRMIERLTGVSPIIQHISFAYPEPEYIDIYMEMFKCSIAFDADITTVRLKVPDLDIPIQTRNDELYEVCVQHCQQVMRSMPRPSMVRSRLRNIFLATPRKLPDLQTVAAKLGFSERNLQRELEADGYSYQGLKDEFRFDLANEYLSTGHLAPKEVAYLLGYANPSAFSRAFKAWTGQTIRQFLQSKHK
ncbi:MAG: AraC family transcriptional regulator ligand-binding domain-containing protein [Georgfuchsia sp.]